MLRIDISKMELEQPVKRQSQAKDRAERLADSTVKGMNTTETG